jgi:hypothetical protein
MPTERAINTPIDVLALLYCRLGIDLGTASVHRSIRPIRIIFLSVPCLKELVKKNPC